MTREAFEKQIHFPDNFDVKCRTHKVRGHLIYIYFLSSLSSGERQDEFYRSLQEMTSLRQFQNRAAAIGLEDAKEEDPVHLFFQGVTVIYLDEKLSFQADFRDYPGRGIEEPMAEKSVRGSRDGFSENYIVNIGLIRRRMKSPHLIIETKYISKRSDCPVGIVYLDDFVSKEELDELHRRFDQIDPESLIMSDRSLEELLYKQRYNPFPCVRYTERPDIVSMSLMQGKIAIVVDTSASVMITPISFFDHLKHVEEFRQSPIIGTFTKILRLIALFLAFFSIPFWLSYRDYTFFSPIPEGYYFNFAWQAIFLELTFEVIERATLHVPTYISSALSLIAGIILGTVSQSIGVFHETVLFICALSSLANLSCPSYELSMSLKVTKMAFLFLTAFFGKNGFLIGMTVLFLYLGKMEILKKGYLFPLLPFDEKEFLRLLIRKDAKKRKDL